VAETPDDVPKEITERRVHRFRVAPQPDGINCGAGRRVVGLQPGVGSLGKSCIDGFARLWMIDLRECPDGVATESFGGRMGKRLCEKSDRTRLAPNKFMDGALCHRRAR